MRAKYVGPGQMDRVRKSIWYALDQLPAFVDVSDVDVSLPNHIHAFQRRRGYARKVCTTGCTSPG
jgi:hypothetical protein